MSNIKYLHTDKRVLIFWLRTTGFFLSFLQHQTYPACTASPNVPNAQAKPQKNLPKIIVYPQRTSRTVTKDDTEIIFPAPIWVKIYLIPAKAAVYADGNNKKKKSCIPARNHICIFLTCFIVNLSVRYFSNIFTLISCLL